MTKKQTLTSDLSKIPVAAAYVALGTAVLTLVLLVVLHILSPEFDPSWRMVSEYANGDYAWVLSLMFAFWGIGSLALAYTLKSQLTTRLGKAGLVLLVISGIGELMAAAFDINHSLHSVASFLGISGAVLASIFIGTRLARTVGWNEHRSALLTSANALWISLVFMIGTFILLVATYAASTDIPPSPTQATMALPEGVIAWVGWANRLVVVTFSVWIAVTAYVAVKVRPERKYSQ